MLLIMPPFLALLLVASMFNITLEEAAVARFFPMVQEQAMSIALCESGARQFDWYGDVIRNQQGSSAVGMFQIMASLHEQHARLMGIDIYTVSGNAQMARFLYDQSGWAPWGSSRHCWQRKLLADNKVDLLDG